MTDQKTDRMYEKIESLLRMAEDPGATEGERNLALSRAAEIAAKYQIDASKLDPHSGQYVQEDIATHTFEVPTGYGLNALRNRGLFQVVAAMGARGYAQDVRKGVEEMVVYAAESTMDVLKVLIPSLIIQEASASAAYIRKLRKDDPWVRQIQDDISQLLAHDWSAKGHIKVLNAEIRRRRKSFCLAFFVEAAKRVEAKRADAVQGAGDKYSIVLVDTKDRIDQAMADLNLRPVHRRKTKWSADAWTKGSTAGAAAMVGQTEVNISGRIALGG